MAIIKPPRKRNIRGLAYGADDAAIGAIPKTGNNTIGSSAVAGMGIASLIHQVAISKTTAVVFHASGSIPEGTGNNRAIIKNKGPRYRPAWVKFIFTINPFLYETASGVR